MRVLYVENSYGEMGGSLVSLLQTARALVSRNDLQPIERRVEPCFYFLYPNLLLDDFRALGPVIVERNDYTRFGERFGLMDRTARIFPWSVQRGLGEILPLAIRVAKHARRLGAGLVHANCRLGSNEYAVIGAKLAGLPVVVHERMMYEVSNLTRAVAAAADAVIAISQVVAEHLTRQEVPLKRLEVIYNGLDATELDHFATAPRETEAPTRVGMVGRITAWKGQHVFIEAARRLASEDRKIEFHIAGDAPPTDEPYLHALRETVKDAGLEDRVIFHGNVKKIYEFMAGMDILAHCSVDPEPLGRVILEGMALGKPCIATRGGAAEEICTDGVDALLVDPNRADLLADSILRLNRDPLAASAMGARARQTISRRFDLETCALKIRGIYEDVLAHPARRPFVESITEFLAANPLARRRLKARTEILRS